MMDTPVIQVENLTKIYPNGVKANDRINIRIRENEIVGIIGPNGAGKTTLIRQLLGLLKPTEGSIRIYGKDIKAEPRLIQETIAYVPQAPLCYPALTVRDVIRYVLQLEGVRGKVLQERTEAALMAMDLGNYAQVPGYQLSGGLLRVVLLAVAWAKRPRVFVLDEPTAMVDIVRKQSLWDLMRKVKGDGHSILLSSHDLNEVKKVCDRIYILVGGRIMAEGTPEEIAQTLRMPVEMEFVPTFMGNALSALGEKTSSWEQNGSLVRAAFQELEDGITFLSNLMSAGGVEYLLVEAPSFERVVTKIMQNKESRNEDRAGTLQA